jgi:hypothetical protein
LSQLNQMCTLCILCWHRWRRSRRYEFSKLNENDLFSMHICFQKFM